MTSVSQRLARGFAAVVDLTDDTGRAGPLTTTQRGAETILRAPGFRAYAVTNAREQAQVGIQDEQVCLFHGWLAEPESLARALGESRLAARSHAELFLAAYRASGVRGLSRMRGEFSALLMDLRSGQLVAVRDPLGIKTLYVHEAAGRLHAASSLELLLPLLPDAHVAPAAIAEYITTSCFPRDPTLTVFSGISQVRPGHFRQLTRGGAGTEVRYWVPEATAELHYQDPREYEDHLREHVFRAVGASVGNEVRVSCELSGGLDSSAVTVAAAKLLEARGGTVIALSYNDADNDLGEREYQQALVTQYGLRHEVFDISPRRRMEEFADRVGVGLFMVQSLSTEAERLIDALGPHVCLTGQGGDAILGNFSNTEFLADLWFFRQWPELLRAAADFRRFSSVRTMLNHVLGRGLDNPWPVPSWLNAGELSPPPVWRVFDAPARQRLFQMIVHLASHFFEDPYRKVEYRHPLLDEALLMYMLRVPWRYMVAPNQSRVLQRRAFEGLLPDKLRLRRNKADFTPGIVRAFRALTDAHPQVVEALQLKELGLVRGEGYSRALRRALHGVIEDDMKPVFTAALFETWLLANDGAPGLKLSSMTDAYVEAFSPLNG
jgi:asparagine synthase (glutamine-hydrolysing)